MKKAFLISSLIFCFTLLKAQGNLQFNQVKFFEPLNGTNMAFTVPAGKVWKVESTSAGSSSCYMYLLNSTSQYIGFLFYPSSSTYKADMPLWFPSGYSGFFSLSNCATYKGMVSIIEFNVVP